MHGTSLCFYLDAGELNSGTIPIKLPPWSVCVYMLSMCMCAVWMDGSLCVHGCPHTVLVCVEAIGCFLLLLYTVLFPLTVSVKDQECQTSVCHWIRSEIFFSYADWLLSSQDLHICTSRVALPSCYRRVEDSNSVAQV